MTDSSTIAALQRRADAYRLLAAAMYPPCDEWREENLFANIALVFGELYPDMTESASKLQAAFNGADPEELNVEAARLFIGPFELVVPLYGSCHLEENRQIMGESTMNVQEFYGKWGVELSADTKDVPDHLAVELEFLNFLVHKQAEALNKEDPAAAGAALQAQSEFFSRFLLPFATSVATQLKASTESEFYIAISDLLALFLKKEEEALQAIEVSP